MPRVIATVTGIVPSSTRMIVRMLPQLVVVEIKSHKEENTREEYPRECFLQTEPHYVFPRTYDVEDSPGVGGAGFKFSNTNLKHLYICVPGFS